MNPDEINETFPLNLYFLFAFSEEEQTLMPYVICLTVALFVIVVAILIIIFRQKHQRNASENAHLPNFNGNKIYTEDSCPANNQKNENWKRYLNKVQSDQKSVDEDLYDGKSNCSQMTDNIYKAVTAEFEKNIASSLPFKKNFEKNELKVSQMRRIVSEQELIV